MLRLFELGRSIDGVESREGDDLLRRQGWICSIDVSLICTQVILLARMDCALGRARSDRRRIMCSADLT